MVKTSIYGLNKRDLINWFIEHNDKKFRATQAWDWLYIKRVASFAEMTNLSKATIALLDENFDFSTLRTVSVQESQDGEVAKYLFQLADEFMIETVVQHHDYGLSVGVTTQTGYASDMANEQRNLTAGEIVAQVVQIQRQLDEQAKGERVSHIVVAGIGEPFDNFANVMKFLTIVNDQTGLEIGARHMTVSTNGVASKIRDFANRDMQVNLAISLQAPNDELRNKIVQMNHTWNLEQLFDAVHYYLVKTNRRITFEYTLLNGVNDHTEEALQLAGLFQDIQHLAYVNLIPYSPATEHDQYTRSPKKHVTAFADTLKKQGINVQIRREAGTNFDQPHTVEKK